MFECKKNNWKEEFTEIMDMSTEINRQLMSICQQEENAKRIVSCFRYLLTKGETNENHTCLETSDVYIIEFIRMYEEIDPLDYPAMLLLYRKCISLGESYFSSQNAIGIKKLDVYQTIQSEEDYKNYLTNYYRL